MASDYIPTNVTSGFAMEVTINQNLSDIKDALDVSLRKDIVSGNSLTDDLDFNGNKAINLPTPATGTEPLRLQDLADFNESTEFGIGPLVTLSGLPVGSTSRTLTGGGVWPAASDDQVGLQALSDRLVTTEEAFAKVDSLIANTAVKAIGSVAITSSFFTPASGSTSKGSSKWTVTAVGGTPTVGPVLVLPSTEQLTDSAGNVWKLDSDQIKNTFNFGAAGDFSTDDTTPITNYLVSNRVVTLKNNNILSEIPITGTPTTVIGDSPSGKCGVPVSASAAAFNVSGTGGTDRQKVIFKDLNFDSGNGQAIRATSTNPLKLDNVRFDTGQEALKLATFFYGEATDCIFLNSGVDMDNVNNFDFKGTDANGAKAVTDGRYLFTDYAFTLNNCIGVQFSDMTFESWESNVFRLTNCKVIAFNRSWFEANESERLILAIDTANITFDKCQIDTTFATTTDSYIQVANTSPSGSRAVETAINILNTDLVLSQSPTAAVNFVKTSDTAGAGKANVAVENCTLISGFINIVNLNTFMRIKNLTLSSSTTPDDLKKGFTAEDTVDVSAGQNSSWVPANDNSQFDFTSGTGGWTESPSVGSTVSVVTSVPTTITPVTGTNALKIATTGAVTSRMNLTMSDSGAITTEGETYVLAIKVWSSVSCTAKLRLLDNASVPQDDSTTVSIGGSGWRWLFMKTNSANMDSIRTSGLDPILRIDFITTAATDIYIDRADFQIVNGDHFLP